MTNALGHQVASNHAFAGVTLGAYRRCIAWVPGATIDVWTKCASPGEDGAPHCYFIQTIGGEDGCSIYCPSCRVEIAARPKVAAPVQTIAPPIKKPTRQTETKEQAALPF